MGESAMSENLSSLIQTAPAFKAAVNLEDGFDDFEKAAAYIPTEHGVNILSDLGRQTAISSASRQRIITGSYGTAKSHIALVLSTLYRGLADKVRPVLERVKQHYPGQAQTIEADIARITPEQPYLVVVIVGDQDDFDLALIRHLRKALQREGLGDLVLQTEFDAAAKRLEQLALDPEAKTRLSAALERIGAATWKSLHEDLLAGGRLETMERFEQLHREVCFDAEFRVEGRVRAVDTYREAARKLVEEGRFHGIVVIWDEFGQFMERVVRDPRNVGGAVQAFAELCQESRENQLHLYLIAHRNLDAYTTMGREGSGLSPTQQEMWTEDFKKAMGRFNELLMGTHREELFELMGHAIIKMRDNGWEQFVADHDSHFTMLAEKAYECKLFQDLSYKRLRERVVESCYPLHPVTVALLPRLSDMVAQNQRTMFTFLCADEPDTLSQFIHETRLPGPSDLPPTLTSDRLWNYFASAIRDDDIYGQKVYRTYQRAVANLTTEQRGQNLVLRLIQLLSLVELLAVGSTGDRSLATEQNLALGLGLDSDSRRAELSSLLEQLSEYGAERVLQRRRDGVYQLISGGGKELREAAEEVARNSRASFAVAKFMRERWGEYRGKRGQKKHVLGLATEVNTDIDAHPVQRVVQVVPIVADEMDNLRQWTTHIGGGDYHDGVLFVVLASEDAQIGTVRRQAAECADQRQLLFMVPNRSLVGLVEVALNIQALETVAEGDAALWGEGGERRDEWEAEYEAAYDRLQGIVKLLAVKEHTGDLDCTILWQGEPRLARVWQDVVETVNRAMGEVFSHTPRIRDDVMKMSSGRDGTAGARRSVIDKILNRDGPRLLENETGAAQRRFINIIEKDLGYLVRNGRPELRAPSAEQHREAHETHQAVRDYVDAVKTTPKRLEELVQRLCSPPFGVGIRFVPMLFALAAREEILASNLRLEQNKTRGVAPLKIDGSTLQDAFRNPDASMVRYVDVTEKQYKVLEGLIAAFGGQLPAERRDVFEAVQNTVARWWATLPEHCKNTKVIDSQEALFLRDKVLRPVLIQQEDIGEVLVEQLFASLKIPDSWESAQFAQKFAEWKEAIEQSVAQFRRKVGRTVSEIWGNSGQECDVDEPQLRGLVNKWYSHLPEETRCNQHAGGMGKLQRCLEREDGEFLDALASDILGDRIEDWADSRADELRGHLSSIKQTLEEWVPPEEPLVSPDSVAPGKATLSIVAKYDGEQTPVAINRQLVVSEPDKLSGTAQMMLRFLIVNFVQDQSLQPHEKQAVLMAFLRQALQDGSAVDSD